MKTSLNLFTSHRPEYHNLPRNLRLNIDSWRNYNSEIGYIYFSDNDVLGWLNNMLSSSELTAFRALNTGAGRADFFRIFYLLFNGGIWHDADLPAFSLTENIPHCKSLLSQYDCVLFNNRKAPGFRYTLIYAKPRCFLIQDLASMICSNIEKEILSYSHARTIDLTGPCVLGRLIQDYCATAGIAHPKTGSEFMYGPQKIFYSDDVVPEADSYQAENTIDGYISELKLIGVEYHSNLDAIKEDDSTLALDSKSYVDDSGEH